MALLSFVLAGVQSDGYLLVKLFAILLLFPIARSITYTITRYASTREFKAKHGCEPIRQFPLKDPILGLDFILGSVRAFNENRFLDTLSNRFRAVGPTFSVRGLHRRSIFTADPENVKTMLSLRFKDYSLGGRQRIMGPLLGKGIFASDGEDWAHSRALLRPNFAKDQVADLSLIELHIGHLFSVLPRDESTVDLQVLFHRFTLDSVTDFLFGKSTNTLTDAKEIDLQFSKSLRFSLDHMAFLLISGPLRRFHKKNPQYLEANRICRAYVDSFVDEVMVIKNAGIGDYPMPSFSSSTTSTTEQRKTGRNSFLRDLANATDDKDKIRGELLSLLLAGRDTTASLLSSLFHHFSRRPDVWNKVREEARQFSGELPSYQGLRNMKYAKYCINEALRLYPPVPTSAKVAVVDSVLPRGGGADGRSPIFIPKGIKVLYSTYSMQRRKDIFGEDADEFRPERWETARFTWEYIPFNGGPRACLGQQYAITESLYVLVRFAQEFENIEARDNLPWTETLGLTVTPASVKVALHRPLTIGADVSKD